MELLYCCIISDLTRVPSGATGTSYLQPPPHSHSQQDHSQGTTQQHHVSTGPQHSGIILLF